MALTFNAWRGRFGGKSPSIFANSNITEKRMIFTQLRVSGLIGLFIVFLWIHLYFN